MCNTFIRILCVIILIIAFIVNTIGNWLGIGDIIPTGKCPCNSTTVTEPLPEESTGTATTTIEFATTEHSTEETTEPSTVTTTTTTTTTTTDTTTTTAPTTTTTTKPVTTTTTTVTTTRKQHTIITTTTKPATPDPNTKPIFLGGNGNDIIRGMTPTSDGGYVICGTTNSTKGSFEGLFESNWVAPYSFVVKYDSSLNIKWIKTFGSTSASFYFNDVAELSNGSIVAVGYNDNDAIIYKLARTNGKTLAKKTVSGTGSDILQCVTVTPTGFAVGGKSSSKDGFFDGLSTNSMFITSYDNNLNLIWNKFLCGNKGGTIEDISADSDGNIFVACTTSSTTGDFADFEELMGGYIDSVIIKYNSDGKYIWDYVIASSARDQFASVAADGNGGCVIGGQYEMMGGNYKTDGTLSGIHNCGGIDALVIHVNADGTNDWTKILSGINDDYITDISVSSKGYAVSGYTQSGNREFASIGNLGDYDGFVCVINPADGATVDIFSQGGSFEDGSFCAAFSTNGKLLTAGRTTSKDGNFTANTGSGFTGFIAEYTLS